MRKIHRLEQGSPEWHAHRNTPGLINGSEIAAIMGLSSYTTRADLVRQKATGITPEVDAAKQARFDRGHLYEALFRPVAESIIDDDLSAMVMSDEIDGVLLSVSLDGITQGYDTTHEHKTLNADLAAALEADEIPEQYHPQMEAGLMVSGATRCLFAASKWEPAPGDEVEPGRTYQFARDDDGNVTRWVLVDSRHAWYESRPELRPKIIAACRQFIEDVKNYVHVEPAPKPVANAIEALPALVIQAEGRVLSTNLDAFKAKATAFIDSIKTRLVTDQDFADADQMVKFLKDGEGKLALAKEQALAQTASLDELFRTVDAISEQMRSKRLALEKLVKAEKEDRKADLVVAAKTEFDAHLQKLNARIGGNWMPPLNGPRWAEAVKGLKSLDSMRDKLATALAHAKIEANEIADRIEANKKAMGEHAHLFNDFSIMCTKEPADFANLVQIRIESENRRVTAERERIRQEEASKLEAERANAASQALTLNGAAGASARNDQRGNAEDATHAQPQATAAPQAPSASTPPLPKSAVAALSSALHEPAVDAVIDDFLRLLPIGAVEKKALRQNIVKWEKYRVARAVAAAADQDMEVAA